MDWVKGCSEKDDTVVKAFRELGSSKRVLIGIKVIVTCDSHTISVLKKC